MKRLDWIIISPKGKSYMGEKLISTALKAQTDYIGVEESLKRMRAGLEGLPTIVCLCGSTRFMDAFFDAGWEETLKGKIVLSVGVCKHAADHGGEALGPEVAAMLDELHKRKIDLADEVFILNVGDYIGESTQSELDYAIKTGKTIRFLEPRK